MEEFPPNSKNNPSASSDKKIEQVTKGAVVRKKKGLGRQFKDTFLAGDPKSALSYVVLDVMLPATKDLIVDAGEAWLRRLILGDSTRRRGATPPQAGPTGYVPYNRVVGSGPVPPPRTISRQARARHSFDEIILESRSEAQAVLDSLYDILSKYDVVTVSDLYGLVGVAAQHTDQKWGWATLEGAAVTRLREGYLLDLPEPQPF